MSRTLRMEFAGVLYHVAARNNHRESIFVDNNDSSLENIELADPGIEWNPASTTLTIHWISGPGSKGEPERRVIKIGPAGVPE